MSWGPLLVNLAVTAGLVAVLMLATFLYAMRTRVHAIMDTIWPLGFVLIAGVSFLLSAGSGGVPGRRGLVLALTAVWGLRLGAHIYSRNRGQGEDKRYASLLRRNRGNLAAFVLRYIYWAQGRVMWFVSLPVQAPMYEHAGISAVTWLGVAVWAVGFGFEAVGDAQLRRFPGRPGQRRAGARSRPVALHPAPELLRRRRGVVRPVVAGVLALARSAAGRLAGVHDEHAGQAHRQAAAREAHGAVQGVRRTPSTFGARAASSPGRRGDGAVHGPARVAGRRPGDGGAVRGRGAGERWDSIIMGLPL
jgi:hypothetical protein